MSNELRKQFGLRKLLKRRKSDIQNHLTTGLILWIMTFSQRPTCFVAQKVEFDGMKRVLNELSDIK